MPTPKLDAIVFCQGLGMANTMPTLINVFSSVLVPTLPTDPELGFYAFCMLSHLQPGRRTVELEVVDWESEIGPAALWRSTESVDVIDGEAWVAVPVVGFSYPRPGMYNLNVLVDGYNLKMHDFWLRSSEE